MDEHEKKRYAPLRGFVPVSLTGSNGQFSGGDTSWPS